MREHFPHCVGEVIGHIESIHAFASGAPLVLVGTRRGDLSEEALAELSDRVQRELRLLCGAAISHLVTNSSAVSWFFAIENTRGFQGDDSIRHLVRAIGSVARTLPCVKQRVPLLWLRVYEELLSAADDDGRARCMELQRVQQIALQCGMPHAGLTLEQELPSMLNFFHSLSSVLWWDTLTEKPGRARCAVGDQHLHLLCSKLPSQGPHSSLHAHGSRRSGSDAGGTSFVGGPGTGKGNLAHKVAGPFLEEPRVCKAQETAVELDDPHRAGRASAGPHAV